MKFFSLLSISLILLSCQNIVTFSKPGELSRVLYDEEVNIGSILSKPDMLLKNEYKRFKEDTSYIPKRFNKGIYMARWFGSDSIHYVEKRNKVVNGSEIELVDFELNNNLSPWAVDKIQYLSFIDNNRVIFYSPMHKIKIKTGEEKIQNLRFTNNNKFARRTTNFLKIGFNKDFKTVKRGYYKVNKDSLFIVLEHSNFKSKIELIGLKFKRNSKLDNLELSNVYFRNMAQDTAIFNKYQYLFYPIKTKMMLIHNNEPMVIDSIGNKGDSIFYHSIGKHLNKILIKESKNNKFTF